MGVVRVKCRKGMQAAAYASNTLAGFQPLEGVLHSMGEASVFATFWSNCCG
jgi:hypothetical protein